MNDNNTRNLVGIESGKRQSEIKASRMAKYFEQKAWF